MSSYWTACSILLITTLAIYHNALYCGFVFDDVSAIKDNKDLRSESSVWDLFGNDFWGTPMSQEKSHKSYRPLTVLTFRLNYWLGELEPSGYHLLNILLHSLVTLQFYYLCQFTLHLPDTTSLCSALLFAVHPVHVEAVTGVVGRAEMLSASLALLTFNVYSTHAKGGIYIGIFGGVQISSLLLSATLCKEQGVTVAAVCVLYDVFIIQQLTFSDVVTILRSLVNCKSPSPNIKYMISRCLLLVVITVTILVGRILVMGAQLPSFTTFDNPATNQSTPYRQLTFNYLTAINVWLLVNPAQLCCDWTMGTVPVIESLMDYRNMFTVVLYLVMYKLVRYSVEKRNVISDQIFMAMILMIFPFLPASNLLFPVGFVVAERVLYMPSMGYCLLFGAVFTYLYSQHHKLHVYRSYALLASYIFLISSGALRTYTRNKDWRNDYTLFSSALSFTEDNAKVWNNVGHALESEERFTEALHYFRNAARVQPDDIGSHINVGRTLKVLGDKEGAERSLNSALDLLPATKKGQTYMARIAPSHLNVFITLGRLISQDEARWPEAEALYKRAISMRPEFIQAYMNYGDILLRLGRHGEAMTQYNAALHYDRRNPDIYYNLGVVYLESKNHQQAMNMFNNALNINPNHQPSLYNTALMIQESGEASLYTEALRRLHVLMELDPYDSKVFFTAALLATDSRQYEAAEQYLQRALQIDPSFKGALFNLALLLTNDLGRPKDSVPFLERNLKLNPDHVKSHLLMGDIAINHLKDVDLAEKCFKTIVKLDPANIQGRHNLCVVYVERGELGKAEKCLEDVLKAAPHEEYIKEHLSVVRGRISSKRKRQQSSHNVP